MSIVSTFLANLGATLLTDEAKIIQVPVENYVNSLIADPSIVNAGVQSMAFDAAVVAVAPQAGSTGIKDTATAIKAFLDIQLPALIAAAAAEVQAAGTATPPPTPPAAA